MSATRAPAQQQASGNRARLKERAALASVAVSSILTLAKFAAGLASGSLAVLSEAGHNLADVAATVLTYFAIKIAQKPADEDHQFGHAKVEALAALAETGFLFALAVYIFIEAITRLVAHETAVEIGFSAFAVLLASIAVDFVRWRALKRIAKQTKSEGLAADSLHFASDIISSTLALGGITASRFGYPQGDALAALGLVAFIAAAGFQIGRRTVNTLVDTAPRGMSSKVRAIARSIPGVVEVQTLRLRPAGAEVVGDIGITVSRTMPLEQAAAIEARVAEAIISRYPDVTLKVAAQPVALDDETVLERILLIAARRQVPIHHVTIQDVDGRNSISFDAELDGQMKYGSAHEIITALEMEIGCELGPGIEVETHIEPLEPRPIKGHPVPEEARSELVSALEHIPATAEIHDVHNVRVKATPEGLVVNYHCRVNPALSVSEVHTIVDDLDRRMRGAFPQIVRIVGHAEPLRN